MAKRKPSPATIRRQQKAHAKAIAQQAPFDDPFHGLGDFVPRDTRQHAIARVIAKLEGLRITKPKAAKPKPVKRSPKPKRAPRPKKGKKVGKVNEVCLKSPFTGESQWLPLVAELSELLAEGWAIVDGDMPVDEAYEFLGAKREAV